MTVAVVTLLAFAAVAALAYPFWAAKRGGGARRDPAEELAEGIRRARERVYEELRALQQERFLGVLTPEEYERQLRAARLRAAELVRDQQQVQSAVRDIERSVDDELSALLAPTPEQPEAERDA